MKKLIALAALAAALPAFAAEVTSSNIVGYTKVALSAGYNMLGAQFVKVGGEASDLAVIGVLDTDMAGWDEEGAFANELRVWDGNGYDVYGWAGTCGTEYLDDPSVDNTWVNGSYESPEEILDSGNGFWVKAATAGEITFAGEVPQGTKVVTLVAGYNMVSYPFPKEVAVSDFGTLSENLLGWDEEGVFANELRVWDGNGYDVYGWSGTCGTDYLDDSSLDNKWLNGSYEKDAATLPVGTGVWVKTSAAGTITFSL